MKRKALRLIGYSALIAAIVIAGLLSFAPYRHHDGFPYRLVRHTVVIDVPADSAFGFLGNSANAGKWSVFVDHISTLNAAEIPDGQVGSRRRCFCRKDETGTRWNEVITEVLPGKKRQIACYNLVDFPLSAEGLATEQIYRPLGPDSCELSFTLYFKNGKPNATDALKMRIASYRVKKIFAKNMENIRRILEGGVSQ